MKWLVVFCALLAGLVSVRADDSGTEKAVTYILDVVEHSDAVFIRNGSEHKAADAAKLLKAKYKHYKSEIKTPEDFIRLAGTKSSTSGKPYLVREKGVEKPAAEWLTAQLEKYRAEAAKKS